MLQVLALILVSMFVVACGTASTKPDAPPQAEQKKEAPKK
jgi:outer membrane lipoprotein-sorting protein